MWKISESTGMCEKIVCYFCVNFVTHLSYPTEELYQVSLEKMSKSILSIFLSIFQNFVNNFSGTASK